MIKKKLQRISDIYVKKNLLTTMEWDRLASMRDQIYITSCTQRSHLLFRIHCRAHFCTVSQIWVRNYQILEGQASNAKEAAEKRHNDGFNTSLVEIGPRFVMNPIRIFGGSFGGQTLYQNADFLSPNEIRAQRLKSLGRVYDDRKNAQKQRKERQTNLVLPEDPLASVFK